MDNKALSPVLSAGIIAIAVIAMISLLYGFVLGVLGGSTKSLTDAVSGLTQTGTGTVDSFDPVSNKIHLRSGNPEVTPVIQQVFEDDDKEADCNNVLLATEGPVELNSTNCPGLTVENAKKYVITGTEGLLIVAVS